MAEQVAYNWDFDRPAAEWLRPYQTFSVGVFQWLKKARGEELRKSPARSRVVGYTAQPERVFRKALELCARLNREGASAAKPPEWLQKQYSIPRPEHQAAPKVEGLTASQVRAVRLRVMRKLLLPAGFVVGKDATYVRRCGEQIQLIQFQTYCRRFTVNIGFHWTFIPPASREARLPLAAFRELDCMARERIGMFLPEKRDTWFDLGDDAEKLAADFAFCGRTAVEIVDRHAARWSDLRVALKDFQQASEQPWGGTVDGLSCGWLELRTGGIAAAQERLDRYKDDRYATPARRFLLLRDAVATCAAGVGAGAGDGMGWPSWVV